MLGNRIASQPQSRQGRQIELRNTPPPPQPNRRNRPNHLRPLAGALILALLAAAGCGQKTTTTAPPPGPSSAAHPATPTDTAPPPQPAAVTPPEPAPPATTFPCGDPIADGQLADTLAATHADYIVITVFAADCAPCIREAKDLDAAVAAWQKRHIALIGISADITRDRVQKFVSQTGLPQNYPMYIAPWFVEDRHVDGTPALFLFDPAAKLLGHWSVDDTPDPFHALQAKLDDLQAGSPLVTPGAEHDPALIVQTWAAAQEDAVAKQLPALAQAFDTLAADQPTGALDETIRLRLSNEALQAFKQPHVVRAFAMKFWRAGTTPQRLTFQWPAPAAKAPGATGWNMGSATDGTNAPAAPTPPPGAVNVTRPGDTADSLRRMLPQGGGDHWNAILQPMYRTADHQALMQVNLDPAAAPSLRVVLWLELPPPPPEVLNALPNAHP